MAKSKKSSSTPRRVSYKFLTMGGRRFVELTPERFARLPEREKTAIERQAKATGEDIRRWTKETWKQLGETPEIRKSVYRRAIYITEGQGILDVEANIAKAFIETLKQAGRLDLAERFSQIVNEMDSDMAGMFYNELPDIHAIYAEKGRSYSKGRLQAVQMTREDSLADIQSVIEKYERELARQ